MQIHIILLVAFFGLFLLEETKQQEQKLNSYLNLKLPDHTKVIMTYFLILILSKYW